MYLISCSARSFVHVDFIDNLWFFGHSILWDTYGTRARLDIADELLLGFAKDVTCFELDYVRLCQVSL